MKLGARRARILGAIWSLAGVGLLAAAVLLWIDRQTISVWEIPVGIVAIWIGVHLWSQRVSIDRHGLTLSSMTGTECILWAGIASVDVQSTWWLPAMTIARKRHGKATSIGATSGLTRTQRDHLFAILFELSREHGFVINRAGRDDEAQDHEATVGTADGSATTATVDAGPTEVETAGAATGSHGDNGSDEASGDSGDVTDSDGDGDGDDDTVGSSGGEDDQEVDSDDDTVEQDETIAMAPVDPGKMSSDDITEEMVVPAVDRHPPDSGSTLAEPVDVDQGMDSGNAVIDQDGAESDTSPQ